MLEKQEGMANLLPDDVLANILHRLAPHGLAMSRCVCKLWCTIIDTHRMLRVDLLPHSVGGIFINFHDLGLSEFLSHPSTGPTISGNFNYLPCNSIVRDHCNGLLLLYGYLAIQPFYVVNPATRQWVQLPPLRRPNLGMEYLDNLYLVFDPTLSSHFEVFQIPYAHVYPHCSELNPATIEGMEWPPSPCVLHVFSTRTKQWEERSFVREGEAAGSLAIIQTEFPYFMHNSVYWWGVLYVRCQTNFVMRISLSDGKYQIIKPPVVETEQFHESNIYMGRSQKGVYCTFFKYPDLIYILDESYGKMEWVLENAIGHVAMHAVQRIAGPWTLQDINYHGYPDFYGHDNSEAIDEQNFDRNSDNDNVIDTTDENNLCFGEIIFLGFHPYKEIVFLSQSLS